MSNAVLHKSITDFIANNPTDNDDSLSYSVSQNASSPNSCYRREEEGYGSSEWSHRNGGSGNQLELSNDSMDSEQEAQCVLQSEDSSFYRPSRARGSMLRTAIDDSQNHSSFSHTNCSSIQNVTNLQNVRPNQNARSDKGISNQQPTLMSCPDTDDDSHLLVPSTLTPNRNCPLLRTDVGISVPKLNPELTDSRTIVNSEFQRLWSIESLAHPESYTLSDATADRPSSSKIENPETIPPLTNLDDGSASCKASSYSKFNSATPFETSQFNERFAGTPRLTKTTMAPLTTFLSSSMQSPRSVALFKTAMENLLRISESEGEDPQFWQRLCWTLEEHQKMLKEKTDEIDAERTRRRVLEDDLMSTRIRLKRLQKELHDKAEVKKSSSEPKELLDHRDGAEQEVLRQALSVSQEELDKTHAALKRASERIVSVEAELGEAESIQSYLHKEMEIQRDRLSRALERAASTEQELRIVKSRSIEEKREMGEKNLVEQSLLKQQLMEERGKADEMREELDSERHALREAHEKLQQMEQELDKATRDVGMLALREEDDRLKEEAQDLLLEKDERLMELENEFDSVQRHNRQLKSELLELEESVDQRMESERLGYQEKIEELEGELNASISEMETLRERLQEAEGIVETLKRDYGKLQKVLKHQAAKSGLDEGTMESLKAELAKERSAKEKLIRAEVEARTQAFTQERDTLIELRANERIVELRSRYEKDLLKLRNQLAEALSTRRSNSHHQSRRDGKVQKGLEATVIKHGETIQTLGQGMERVFRLLTSGATGNSDVESGPTHEQSTHQKSDSCRQTQSRPAVKEHTPCNTYYHLCHDGGGSSCNPSADSSDVCLLSEYPCCPHSNQRRIGPRHNNDQPLVDKVTTSRYHQQVFHPVPAASTGHYGESQQQRVVEKPRRKGDSHPSNRDLQFSSSVSPVSSYYKWPQAEQAHQHWLINKGCRASSPRPSRFRCSSLEPRRNRNSSRTKRRIRETHESHMISGDTASSHPCLRGKMPLQHQSLCSNKEDDDEEHQTDNREQHQLHGMVNGAIRCPKTIDPGTSSMRKDEDCYHHRSSSNNKSCASGVAWRRGNVENEDESSLKKEETTTRLTEEVLEHLNNNNNNSCRNNKTSNGQTDRRKQQLQEHQQVEFPYGYRHLHSSKRPNANNIVT